MAVAYTLRYLNPCGRNSSYWAWTLATALYRLTAMKMSCYLSRCWCVWIKYLNSLIVDYVLLLRWILIVPVIFALFLQHHLEHWYHWSWFYPLKYSLKLLQRVSLLDWRVTQNEAQTWPRVPEWQRIRCGSISGSLKTHPKQMCRFKTVCFSTCKASMCARIRRHFYR